MGREREIKFNAHPEMFREVRERFDYLLHDVEMETTYYDTPGRYFYMSKSSLRKRRENDKTVYCVKSPINLFERNEWETEDGFEALAKLCQRKDKELAQVICGPLVEVGTAHFTRHTGTMRWKKCTVEISLDEGYLASGLRRLPVCEIEVELKSGDWEACKEQAMEMGRHYDLWKFNGASKAARVFSMYYEEFFQIPKQPL